MMGKTIDAVTYYTENGVVKYDIKDTYVPVKFDTSAFKVENADVTSGSVKVTLPTLPKDYVAEYAVEGLTNVSVENGTLKYNATGVKPGQYTLNVTDKSAKYAPFSASFTLTTNKSDKPSDATTATKPSTTTTATKPSTTTTATKPVKKVTVKKQTVKVKAGKKKLTVTWKKDKNVSGYQIKIATKKNFKGAKTYTVKSYKTYKKVIKKLKAKKKYFVKVRAYKTVGKSKVYGAYSAVRSCKVK